MTFSVAMRYLKRHPYLQLRLRDALLGYLEVAGVYLHPDELPPRLDTRHSRRARTHEGVEDARDIVGQIAQAPNHQPHGLLGRVFFLKLPGRPTIDLGRLVEVRPRRLAHGG